MWLLRCSPRLGLQRRWLVVVALCCVAASTMVGAAAARAATAPAGFFGVGGWSYPTPSQASALGSAGVRSWRAGLVWNDIEPVAGQRRWGDVDRLMANAADNGYGVLLVINGCARWACGETRVAPAEGPQMDAFKGFVTAAVARYGAGGSFWKGRPGKGPATVSWQVWNEVNTGADWPNPTAAGYAAFLKGVGATIKATDPQATVVASGLTEHPAISSGVTGARFLSELYAQPGFAASFDVAAVHGYASDTAGTVRILDAMRQVTVDNGDAGRPMWVTELGWADGGPAHPFVRDTGGLSAEMQRSFDTMLGCRARWNLDRVFWFSLQDLPARALNEPDYWGFHTGLLTVDGTAKGAFATFKSYTDGSPLGGGRADTCDLVPEAAPQPTPVAPAPAPAPTKSPPDTTITSTPSILGRDQNASVSFVASEAGARFECALDGGSWSPCTTPLAIASGREGSHEVFVRAIDAAGNADASPARGTWMVDLTPPSLVLTARPPAVTTKRAVDFGFSGRDAVGTRGFECQADSGAWRACGSPYRTPRLKVGCHKISLRAIDFAGNVQVSPTLVAFVTATPRKKAARKTRGSRKQTQAVRRVAKIARRAPATPRCAAKNAKKQVRSKAARARPSAPLPGARRS